MSRTARPAPAPAAEGTTTEILAAKGNALVTHSQHSLQVSSLFADGVPYERERVIGQTRIFMATSAEAMLQAGQCLIQLKENEPHGDFVDIIEARLGMSRRTAQVMMQAATRYLAPALQAKAQAPALLGLGKAKLLELLIEPDESIEALAAGGTVAGLDIDDMQSMTSRELRAALAEERKRLAAKDRVIAKKDAKLNELAEREELRRNGRPDEREQAQVADLRDAGLEAEQALQRLAAAVDQVMQEPATEAAELAARQTVDYVVQRLADALLARGITVDLMGERIDPDWAKAIASTAAAEGKAGKRRA